MNTGQCKFRKCVDYSVNWLLPKCKDTNPQNVSIGLMLFGILTGVVYFFSTYFPYFYFLGIILIGIRLVIETLDEKIAITYQKQNTKAMLLNLLSPEIADIFLMIAITLADFDYMGVGVIAISICWAMILFDLAGLISGHETKRKGPLQEPYRVMTLMLASLLQFFAQTFHWPVDFIYLFLVWIIVGGLITLVFRWRHLFHKTNNKNRTEEYQNDKP